jgi:hypothetical protein
LLPLLPSVHFCWLLTSLNVIVLMWIVDVEAFAASLLC